MIVVMTMAVRMGVTMFQARAMVVAMGMDVGVEMIMVMVMIVAVIMIGVMRVIHFRGQFLTIDTGFTLATAAHGTHLFNL